MRRIFAGAVFALFIGFTAADAAASSGGYVCRVRYFPKAATGTASERGTVGYVEVTISGQANCQGNSFTAAAMSTGATAAGVDANYLYRELPLMALYQSLVRAASDQVSVQSSTLANGQLQWVSFSY